MASNNDDSGFYLGESVKVMTTGRVLSFTDHLSGRGSYAVKLDDAEGTILICDEQQLSKTEKH